MDTRTLCETRWDWMADQIRDTWSNLPEDAMRDVAGNYEGVVTLISESCGYGWDEAAERLDEVVCDS